MPGRLHDRIVFVTGGTGQLGRHVVERCLAEGGRVHVPVHSAGGEDLLREHLGSRAGGVTFHGKGDLTDPTRVEAIFRDVEKVEGRSVQVLLNLAGDFAMSPVEETAPDTWRSLWERNATTAFLCSRTALPRMAKEGWGRIVNVSAFPALDRGQAGLSAYGAAKAAVLNLTHSLAKEGGKRGVTVNAVLPSIIDTPQNREAMPEADRATWLPPEAVAGVMVYLASEDARIVNGAAIPLTLD